ncbi:MAG: hypothetical protein G01um101444_145 [Parcubacteria group bacterium Gr01-1014_44]|nr:MAG: hypothetical protein G01um101444_145 [Parcubacteria group bacterium Gr01-1014_44]
MGKKKTDQRRRGTLFASTAETKSMFTGASRLIGILFFITIFVLPLFVSAKNYPDGTLIRAKGDIKVYLIKDNKKEWIKSLAEFKAKKLSWKRVKIISLKEFDSIKENVSDSPTPTSAITPLPSIALREGGLPAAKLISSPQASPSVLATVSPLATPPIPAKINSSFPALDYARADWLISHITSNYGRIGQKIVFKYSIKDKDSVKNFRLYEKKPGGLYFTRVAAFKEIPSTGCDDIDIDGEWMMTEGNPCGYWVIQRIIPPGGRGTTAYLPAVNYSEGEYSYYVAGVDTNGLETPPSPETKLVFLPTAGIFSPADNKQSTDLFPTFKWSVFGWPAGSMADYLILISDDQNAQNPFWAKSLKVSALSEQSFTYDGNGLNPASKYKVYIYGHYRQSEYGPDYISIPPSVPEFWVKTPGWSSSVWKLLRALLISLKVRPSE